MGGMEEGGQAFKVNNGGRERMKGCPRKKKGMGIYIPSHKNGRYSFPGRIIWSPGQKSAQKSAPEQRARGGWIIRPRQNNNTKTVITFASGLHFR
jgi:hypothetical protein